ncbi:MAG TPA: hypothetical protein VN040_19200 [Pseudosphingobacterium sp.]|nr:hypothetical protein [Pseudosphingobacterium sp.]
MKLKSLLFPTLIAGVMFLTTTAKSQTEKPLEYKLERVIYNISNDKIREVLEAEKSNTSFKKGQPFNIAVFKKERARIETLVRAKMDSTFTKDQVSFRIDTTLSNHMYAIETIISNNSQR